MKTRYLSPICFAESFGSQMRFIAGPRQSGKTTMVQNFLEAQKQSHHYFNWDYRETRIHYQKNNDWYVPQDLDFSHQPSPWIAFDEIHKYPMWKNILKEAYDKYKQKIQFIVTGSARLNMFRKSGDSLAGRYFLFHLFPMHLAELTNATHRQTIPRNATTWIKKQLSNETYYQNEMESLLTFSGFPDPLIKSTKAFQRKWRHDYLDKILHEDISQIGQVQHIENISQLFLLLPSKIASPLSINSLREDLLVSYNALKNYLYLLDLAYITFSLAPYDKHIARAIKKEKKLYFFDYTHIEDESNRFENYIALELKTRFTMLNDLGHNFDLRYIRTKDKKETDFLILKDQKPWCLIEVKLSSRPIENHHYKHAKQLGNIPFIQIVKESGIAKQIKPNVFEASASRFFGS